ncbi:MAG: hypothetical protein ACRDD7_12555 [Peptostreptococcaceae bacterium]
MYTNLILYRNELKNKNIPKYKVIGIVTELLYSKQIFNKNSEIVIFIKDVFNTEFKDYIMKSRSMIIAKVSKLIIESKSDTQYKANLLKFINLKIEVLKEENKGIKENKNDFDGWIV